ncbi:adenylyl-sulfate kinase [bacterium]|nr:adenylyl-sulfate kinase [bacterium]
MTIWLIGKSGSGKSEIGKRLYDKISLNIPNIIYLDGDVLRNAISWDLGHTLEDRYTSEKRRSQLCKLLSDQNISIICSALSNAPDLREWNKQNIRDYYEIYLKVDQSVLRKRDPKGLYRRYENNNIKNMVGENITFHKPESPWLTVNNDGTTPPDKITEFILNKIKINKLLI